jgi:nucleotide-binding universal stress UspA family protein
MRVLVATDASVASDEAMREGVALASSPDDVLAVLHVLPLLAHQSLFLPARDAASEARASQIVASANAAVRERAARFAPNAKEIFVDEGIDYAGIVRRAQDWRADVIVLGSHGRSGITHMLGGVAERVVRYAHCAVLVVRAATARGCVIAATDLSSPSLPAVAAAAREARRRSARLKVVHALSFLDWEATYLVELASPSIPKTVPERDMAQRALSDAVAKLGVEAECEVLDTPAAAAIVRHAEESGAELIVVGTHGKTGLARVLLGSVAEKIVRAASCSVLVVRQPVS